MFEMCIAAHRNEFNLSAQELGGSRRFLTALLRITVASGLAHRADHETRGAPAPRLARDDCPAAKLNIVRMRAEREQWSKPALSLSNGVTLGIRCRLHRIDQSYPSRCKLSPARPICTCTA